MNNVRTIFTLLLCLAYIPIAAGDRRLNASNDTINFGYEPTDLASQGVPGRWISLGPVVLIFKDTVHLERDAPCDNVLCTSGIMNKMGSSVNPRYYITMTRMVPSVKDDNGNEYKLAIVFPPESSITVMNRFDRTNKYTKLQFNKFNKGDFTVLRDTGDIIKLEGNLPNCGGVHACDQRVAAFYSGGGNPELYLKLPETLAAKEINFMDVPVLKLDMYIEHRGYSKGISTDTAFININGHVIIPQRCYIRADNNTFNFGAVYPNNQNGLVNKQEMVLSTDCYNASSYVKQYLHIQPVSGGSRLVGNDYIYQIAADSASQTALGIMYAINSQVQCLGKYPERQFNSRMYLRDVVRNSHFSEKDKISFGLCKYGIPVEFGEKKVVLRLISRWELNK